MTDQPEAPTDPALGRLIKLLEENNKLIAHIGLLLARLVSIVTWVIVIYIVVAVVNFFLF
jgi:hypothetical protein